MQFWQQGCPKNYRNWKTTIPNNLAPVLNGNFFSFYFKQRCERVGKICQGKNKNHVCLLYFSPLKPNTDLQKRRKGIYPFLCFCKQ